MEKITLYLKQFAEWATGLTDKYRYNLFIRTTTNVILLQVLLTLLTIVVFWWAIGYIQQNIIDSISTHITELASGASTTQSLPQSIEQAREQTLWFAFITLVGLTALFGTLISRFALWPTRNSLQFQKRFIGNVAHEIRTPLAIIKTNTEVALMDPSLDKDVKETFEETIIELNRISETINNLLSFDKLIRPGRMEMNPVDMREIITTVMKRHEELAESRGISLICEVNDSPYVMGNATALEQVITNLVKNAINYTPANKDGKVKVTLEPTSGGSIAISVSDTGIGIGQKDLYHIFEPFYRGDTSRARGIGTGTSGLGLAIVNEIIRLHGGTITIRSTLNVGTSFKITLPKAEKTEEKGSEQETEGLHEISMDFS